MAPLEPRKVSVIVPTYNRPALLREALASIRALEGQDLVFEILVGDNACDAGARSAAAEFGASYLSVARRGASAARNAGLRAATGEFIAFLDDDDVWLAQNIRPQIRLLDQRPDLDAVLGQVVTADYNLVPVTAPWPREVPGEGQQLLIALLSGYFPQIGGFVCRARVPHRYGVFDEQLIGGEDLDWMLRIARRNALGFTATPSVLCRARPAGTFDALQRLRLRYDRRVFLRHAIPEWRIWSSPLAFSGAYSGTLMHFYDYFVNAAVERAQSGESRRALSAIAIAVGIFPLRGIYHLLAPRPLRRALIAALSA